MPTLVLRDSARLRYATFFYLYVMQGIPAGFGLTAVYNYLIGSGLSAREVGSFAAIVGLPWTLFTTCLALVNLCTVTASYLNGWLLEITTAPVIGLGCGGLRRVLVPDLRRRRPYPPRAAPALARSQG